jgi:4,5-dihydroxyphthalate decarboxylase
MSTSSVTVTATSATAQVHLRMLLGSYHNTLQLKTGMLTSPLVNIEFDPVKVANRAFKRAVREDAFDFAELALVTFLQAKAYGKPLVLMPAVLGEGRFQHHCLVYNAERGHIGPGDLAGKRIGVRAHSQTTVTWVRGILSDDYGVDLSSIRWLTMEDGHVAEYVDPPEITRAPADKTQLAMLLAGELDLAILGSDLPDDPRLQPVLPEPHVAAHAWAHRHGVLPINHMVAVNADLCRERPDIVREVYRLLQTSKQLAGPSGPSGNSPDMTPFGLEPNRRALDMLIRYSHEQGLIPRRFDVDELFDDTTRVLSA